VCSLFKKIKTTISFRVFNLILAGKHFDFFSSVKDIKSNEVWAEIGVLFCYLVSELSFKKINEVVGGTASITAVTQIITMVLMGFLQGNGWVESNGIHLLG
jgi:CPA2 family monovalent cation:H+ antiporter-2